jgi:tRNA threonylcarbamoyladenosine biosynthesis protein TsaB
MACILNIETATPVCSAAVAVDGKIVFERINTDGPSHASLLGVFAGDAIHFIRDNGLALDAVAVSCGPGSYTGLRIGVSEAKGLCFGMDLPLLAVNTLLIMAAKIAKSELIPADAWLCPMLDARRMEVYAAIYNRQLEPVRETGADIVNVDSYSEYLSEHQIVFFGNGAEKCKKILTGENVLFLDGVYPSAADMAESAEKLYQAGAFVDAAYFEPFYLKEFVATVPKNRL